MIHPLRFKLCRDYVMAVIAQQESPFAKYGNDVRSTTKSEFNEADYTSRAAKEIESVFRHLNGHEKASLLNLGEVEKFNSGAKILNQGEFADALYVVIDGETCVVRRDHATTRFLKKGVFSCTSLLSKIPEQADVIANGKVFAFTMPTDILTKLMRFDAFFSDRLESCLKNYFQFDSGNIEQSTN